MRIAHLIESDGPGGAEQVVGHMATMLQAAGARNVVFVHADGEGWLARQLEGSGVAVEYFRQDERLSRTCARTLEEGFRRHRIEVAHSHEFAMAVYGAWASWRAGIPHVITMHGGRYYAGRLRRRLALRAAIAASGRTVAVSRSLASQLSRDLWIRRSRVTMIANGVRYVRPDRVTLREELGLGPDDRLVVSIGNLYPVKGHCHLIEAVARLATAHPTVHVAIAGRGGLLESLTVQARDRGVAGRIHFLGLRADVAAVLEAADLFVLPSLSEGLPLALLEAMFARRPIVATDVGEVATALAGGEAGALVEPGNPSALTAAIDSLLSDPNRAARLADAAVHRAAAEYDVAHMVRRYAEVYGELLRWPDACTPAIRCTNS
jgi:glycosyltransferase involved in cell wall biosynthesis